MLLNCHSYFSMCYGTLSVENLIKHIVAQGYQHFALTDVNNTSAWIETSRKINTEYPQLKLALGVDFRNGAQQQYIGIAQNNHGLYELNEHLSQHLHQKKDFAPEAPPFEHVAIVYPLNNCPQRELRPHEWIGIKTQEINKLGISLKKLPVHKLVALQTLTFVDKTGYNTHRLLRAIDHNLLGSQLKAEHCALVSDYIIPKDDFLAAFKAYPIILENTTQLLTGTTVDFGFGKFANKNLACYTDSLENDLKTLYQEALKGAHYRYGDAVPEVVMQRINTELKVVGDMKFASYFLINWDIVNYARSKGYFYIGRGSGANSLLAYLLRITDVDPIELNLYFERFINPFRSTPPDFDIDFSWTDRDDITAYIFKRFGQKGSVALLGAYNTFQFDAAVRELGKVYGLPPAEIDRLQRIKNPDDIEDTLSQSLLRYAHRIIGFPSHNSIHASGIIISEKPIHHYTATFLPPKGFPTTHFSMIEAEDIGLYKFDILSQRGLGKIKDCIEMIKRQHGVTIDPHKAKLFTSDERVKELLRNGKTIGCFYVESPAMRMLLCKLKADDYLRLVAASSIIRPGVSQSGMMREYIMRFRNEALREKARLELPELYALLEETYGVMVYQEDVIKIAHLFAELTLAEADFLRRGMNFKFKQRDEFGEVKQQFFENCKNKGYALQTVLNIWNQIESFANFAFSKGHSASYAVESYQALYLKAYYPIEYLVATVNNGGGFYRTEVYLHEAQINGAELKSPCVNEAEMLTTVQGNTITIGFHLVKDLQEQSITAILKARNRNGKFKDLGDFIERVPIALEQIRLLISIGGFDFTQKSKMELLWQIHEHLLPQHKQLAPTAELFKIKTPKYTLPALDENKVEALYTEMEVLGFTKQLPFKLLKNPLNTGIMAKDFKQHIGKTIAVNGYLVNVKYTRTAKKDIMCFGTFLDTDGDWIDSVHFPPSLRQYPFAGRGCYAITGKVSEEFDFISLEVQSLQRLDYIDREL